MSLATLIDITNDLLPQYPDTHAWDNSPFAWILHLPPGSKGVIGRSIASGLLQSYGLTPMATGHRLTVNAQGILVRIAMAWDTGVMKFQNMRDEDYEHVLCIGLLPQSAQAWFIPKTEIWQGNQIRTDNAGISGQHEGADAWLSINPSTVQSWVQPYGGTIESAMHVAQQSL